MGRGKSSRGSEFKTDLKVLKVGERMPLREPVELALEDGTRLKICGEVPRDLPCGYHEMHTRAGLKTHLMVTPYECHLPKALHTWGWAVQLYALRSKDSWGMGDFKDLQKFGNWAAQTLNCGFLLANPLVAATPILPQQASPYFPSSRRFLNPLYLRVEDIPGAAEAEISIDQIAAAGRALNQDRLIDRDVIFRLKMQALEKIWKHYHTEPEFESFCAAQGKPLLEFATFCVLAQYFQSGWTQWPLPFRHPGSPSVLNFVREHSDRIRFYQWLQWLAEQQLRLAVKELPVIQDLPVGVDPAGADAWCWQEMLAQKMTIGAPPDAYSSEGQNWGMQPFIPHLLRESYYEPFRQTVRAALRFGGGLRIDHVMGLFRLFWVPGHGPAREGAYVHYPADEMLSILAIESQRAGALIIGEDLGTVEPGVRRELWRRKILSYRLLWFESGAVKKFPRRALAAVTTHDLFTVAGLWNGSDAARQKKGGLEPNTKDTQKVLKRLQRRLNLRQGAKISKVVVKTHQLLAKAPSMLLTATLDDALAVEERPNMPGTTTGWPNWSLALPYSLEAIKRLKLPREVAKACKRKLTRQMAAS